MVGIVDVNSIITRRITEKFYICGDSESDTSAGMGLVSSRVMVCAGHQAHAVIRIIDKFF